MTTSTPGLGGWTPEEPVTSDMESICIEVRSDVEKAAGSHFDFYIPKIVRIKIVSGRNYLFKVKVGVDKYVHAMIFRALPCHGETLSVLGVQYPKTLSDPLMPF